MRITHNILINNFLRNLNSISQRIERTQLQLATGLKYNRPGDGPLEVGQSIGLDSSDSKISQYLKNVDDGQSRVGFIDTILQSVIGDMGRARDLATDGANDNLNLSDRQAIGQEINLILESTFSNSNSRFRDRYTFAGWQTLNMPFEAEYNERTGFIEDILYRGNRGKINRLVGDNDELAVNVSGDLLFLEDTYTLTGRELPTNKPLGFSGVITVNGFNFTLDPDWELEDLALALNSQVDKTSVFARVSDGRLLLESAKAVGKFTLSDNQQGRIIEDLGLDLSGPFNIGTEPPDLVTSPIVDSTPAIFTGAGPVANLTYDETNNVMNIFLGADANDGVSKAANIIITPGTYASVADLINEIQARIDEAFGKDKIVISDAGGGVLQLETVATGDEIGVGDLVIGGPFNGLDDTASDSADLNLVAVVGNAPPTNATTAGTDGNDKIIIDLGPLTSKTGEDELPQVIDLRAGVITNNDELLEEIKYQIFQNDILRGAVDVSYYNGRLKFETVKQGEDIPSTDFVISEGATNTLSDLYIQETLTPAYFEGTNPIPPAFIVVTGLNDRITIDLGPSVSLDGTDPEPVEIIIDPGVYSNPIDVLNEIAAKIQAEPTLNGAISVSFGSLGNNLRLTSVNTGSDVRGRDINVFGPLASTLGWGPGDATPGGGTVNGRGTETLPSNVFSTLISIREDLMGTVGLETKFLNIFDKNQQLTDLLEGDMVTVTYDAGSFSFRVLATDTMEDFINNLQSIFDSRAEVSLSTDGRIVLTNQETFPIQDVTITAANPSGSPKPIFNDLFDEMPENIPGLTATSSDIILDLQRYKRLGNEDLVAIDKDYNNVLKYEAIVGARANRLTGVTNLFEAESTNVKELNNAIMAANYPEVLTFLSQQELVLQSALGVGARVLTPSLLEYLS